MAIFRRIRDILAASVNDLVERVEDPEQLLDEMIREMEQSIAELRRNAAAAIAVQKVTARKLERTAHDRATWQQNAEAAVRHGRDDEARAALTRRRRSDAGVAELEAEAASQAQLVDRLKMQLRGVEEKVQQTRMKRDTLLAKKRAAQARERMAQHLERSDQALHGAQGLAGRLTQDFDRVAAAYEDEVETRVARAEAQEEIHAASAGLKKELQALHEQDSLDAELEEMKRRMEG